MIEWEKLKKEERPTITKIVKRAVKMIEGLGYKADYITLEMDLSACHIYNPLRLEELLTTDNFNFAHDIFGIRQHINRETGKLTGCFLPRFSKKGE